METLPLRKYFIPETLMGDGALNAADKYLKRFAAERILLITDPGIIRAGWTNQLESILVKSGFKYEIFSDITENPKDYEIRNGVNFLETQRCDLILALGGGSVMDAAKAIGVCSANNTEPKYLAGVDLVRNPGLPLICIPTTAGSASEVTQFAIINETTDKRKIGIISKKIVPDVAIVDPLLTLTLEPEITAASGYDVICHSIEAYVSTASSPITDLNAEKAFHLAFNNLKEAYQNPENISARNKMMTASMLAGYAFTNSGLGLTHALSHSLGGRAGIKHGECTAYLLDSVIRHNYPFAAEKYDTLSNVTSKDNKKNSPENLIEMLGELREAIGLGGKPDVTFLSSDDLDKLAANAAVDCCIATNPGPVSRKIIRECYEQSF